MNQFNINELLEKKKNIESRIKENFDGMQANDVKYEVSEITDHSLKTNKVRKIETRPKVSLEKFTKKIYTLTNELAEVKKAIQKYNAENVLGKIQQREATRLKLNYLTRIKAHLMRDKSVTRDVTRENNDGEAMETTERTIEPMFTRDEVDKEFDTLANEERKINTEIQKINLNAKITLGE